MKDKNFYIMLADPPWAGPVQIMISGPDIRVYDGEYLEGVVEAFKFNLSVDAKAPNPCDFPPLDLHGPNRHLMFSDRLVGILDRLGVINMQYFDAEAIYEPSGAKVSYKVANVLGLGEGLNMEESEVLLSPRGNVVSIERMCLDEEKLSEIKICRLKEDPMLIVVHRSIREAVEEAGLTGFMFIADDEYEPGMI